MNPWSVLIMAIAGLLIVVAVKGTQDNLVSAVLGRSYGNSTLGNGSLGNGPPPPTSGVIRL